MPDAIEFVKIIKKAAIDAMESTKPVNVNFGVVISESPLQISVEQKMILGKNQLILSRAVTDYKIHATVQWETDSGGDPEHNHAVTGTKEVVIHNQLKAGDEVLLIRQQRGQKYIVIDRIGVM